jgi:hypothetical protein
MRVMVVAMMEMRLHGESIRPVGEVVNTFPVKLLTIFCVKYIEILDRTNRQRLRLKRQETFSGGTCPKGPETMGPTVPDAIVCSPGAIIGGIHGPALWHQAR